MLLSVEQMMQLMDKLRETGLQEFSLQQGDFSLALKAREAAGQTAAASAVTPPTEETVQTQAAPAAEVSGNTVTSPIVGTFYAAVSEDKPPYVTVGSHVEKGDTLCIIESMKIMNEIQSDFSGTVVKILAENGQMAEYGQPLFVIA